MEWLAPPAWAKPCCTATIRIAHGAGRTARREGDENCPARRAIGFIHHKARHEIAVCAGAVASNRCISLIVQHVAKNSDDDDAKATPVATPAGSGE